MTAFLSWYLLITLFGLAAVPLAWTWLRWLPDRGWGLSRALGWLLAGFFVWFLGSLGFVRVSPGSGLAGLVAVAALSLVAVARWGGGWRAFGAWLDRQRALILAQELLFLGAFALWTFYRAHDNAIAATEKPMEFAFLNGIVAAGAIPPPDPWLSGFAISYYYFGYVLMAVLTVMSGIDTAVAFNLGIALLFALSVSGAYSLAFALISRRAAHAPDVEREGEDVPTRSWGVSEGRPLLLALLGPLLLVGISNLTGLVEITNANGIGPASFYEWLDIKDFPAGQQAASWHPDTTWWWWRASRTIHDRVPFTDTDAEVIDEFPYFSFLLGDMHPHVLALPFVLLALGLGLNLLRGALAPASSNGAVRWNGLLLPGWRRDTGWGLLTFVLTAVVLGGLGFLNSWDFPTYSLIFVACWMGGYLLRQGGFNRVAFLEMVTGTLALLLLGVALYLPFYLGFRSQAGGLELVSFFTKTQWQQYLLMFGLFFVVLIPMLAVQLPLIVGAWRDRGISRLAIVLILATVVPLGVALALRWWTTALLAVVLGLTLLALEYWLRLGVAAVPIVEAVESSEGAQQTRPVIAGGSGVESPTLRHARPDANLLFALLLFAVAILLTLGTEFVFIKDTFGSRMNTVFKLYYQAWTLYAIASAFGVVYLARRLSIIPRVVWSLVFAFLLAGSLLYPIAAAWSKADRFQGEATLNGMDWYAEIHPDDYAAIQWLKQNVEGQPVILEATGGSYSPAAAVSMSTGFPTVLGWDFHEMQWRGSYDEPARRKPDIERIYRTTDPHEARELLDKYGVRYVYIGQIERCHGPEHQNAPCNGLTPPQIDKFGEFMTPVFEQGQVIIFGR